MSTESPGQRMRILRTAKGLTQRQLANAVKVTQPCIALWEADETFPETVRTLRRLAEALGTTIDFLLPEEVA